MTSKIKIVLFIVCIICSFAFAILLNAIKVVLSKTGCQTNIKTYFLHGWCDAFDHWKAMAPMVMLLIAWLDNEKMVRTNNGIKGYFK